MQFKFNDGGRAASGRKGEAGDCVARAVAIVSGRPYDEVYNRLAAINAGYRGKSSARGRKTAREGIVTRSTAFNAYMAELGLSWTPTMQIGQGCKVHLRANELPSGRLIAMVSRHAVAVIDGVANDIFDPSRDGMRCVYGYWKA